MKINQYTPPGWVEFYNKVIMAWRFLRGCRFINYKFNLHNSFRTIHIISYVVNCGSLCFWKNSCISAKCQIYIGRGVYSVPYYTSDVCSLYSTLFLVLVMSGLSLFALSILLEICQFYWSFQRMNFLFHLSFHLFCFQFS